MSLRHALLGLLNFSPSSGYELAKHFEHTLRRIWHARNHQLYPELARLAADGHVRVVEEGVRGRRTYAITDDGHAELRRWLVEVEPDRTMRSETYLRAFLLSTVLSRQDALAVLDKEIEVWTEQRAGLLEVMERSARISPPHGSHNLAMDLTLRMTDAMLGWSREAAERIAQRPDCQ
jgi:PadR family transcriptional regulator, regulatory protein AphA